jgi:hypothetical protein
MAEQAPLTDSDIIALGVFSGNQINAANGDLNLLYDPAYQESMRADARIALLGASPEIVEAQRFVPEGVDDSL